MNNKKKRNTIQKMKILEHLRKVKNHPSAELVYNEVRKELPTITLATVYRNLNSMALAGEITKLEINNEFRFDGETCKHQHCVCKKCGCIIDVFQKEISEYAMKRVESNGFTPECVNIIFTGECKKCGG